MTLKLIPQNTNMSKWTATPNTSLSFISNFDNYIFEDDQNTQYVQHEY